MLSSLSSTASNNSAPAVARPDSGPPPDRAAETDAGSSPTVASATSVKVSISAEGSDRLASEEAPGKTDDGTAADGAASGSAVRHADTGGAPAAAAAQRGGAGQAQGGGNAGASGSASTSNKVYEAADANEDGKVSQQEQLNYDAAQAAARKAASGAQHEPAPAAAAAVRSYRDVEALTAP